MILVMNFIIKKSKKIRVEEGRPRIKWGVLTPDSALEIDEKVAGLRVWEYRGNVNVMWDRAASCITETTREVLGVARGRARRYKGKWWWNEEFKKKVEMKKGGVQRRKAGKRGCIGLIRLESERVGISTKLLNEEEDRGIELGELEHLDERRDFSYCRRFKIEEVKKAIRRIRRGRVVGPDEIPMDFWKCIGGAGLRWLTDLFNDIFKTTRMQGA
ncbi:uncharacterized protein LOC124886651 [Capsicum annuum]|uniref:uncharacterized protein LOC124886651 n=1 Tax=Capsicum annuum TaxID=4072 RepID=UPI001FB08480|nr:uncharacterized protein LOC124886651 [Capsicum annuum]